MGRFYNVLGDECGALLWASEPFDTKEGFHTHAMLKTFGDIQWVAKAWQIASAGAKYGKNNRIDIQRYNPKLGANFYVGKYIGKRLSDWDIECGPMVYSDNKTKRAKSTQSTHADLIVTNLDAYYNEIETTPPIKLTAK